MQKQPLQKFCKKPVLKNFAILTGKHLCWNHFLIQNIANFFRAPILKNICEWLLYARIELIKRRSKVQEGSESCERALKFDQWKTFSENYKSIRVWLRLIYRELLPLVTFLQVYSNSKELSYLSWQNKYLNLKTNCHIKLKYFLWPKLLEGLLFAKYLIYVAGTLNKFISPIKWQCCPHVETSQLIFCVNQLTGFYMRATLELNGLISNEVLHSLGGMVSKPSKVSSYIFWIKRLTIFYFSYRLKIKLIFIWSTLFVKSVCDFDNTLNTF